jgi:hypothetical protein
VINYLVQYTHFIIQLKSNMHFVGDTLLRDQSLSLRRRGSSKLIFKNSARTIKKTQRFTITKMNWLMPFKDIIPVYSENHTKPINTKCRVTDC